MDHQPAEKRHKSDSESDQPPPLVIDGAQLEGGGQILRNVAALSACLGISVRITSIRAGRDKARRSAPPPSRLHF